MDDMHQLNAVGKLVKPRSYVCAKYHKHRSVEEKMSCPEYHEEEPEVQMDDDEVEGGKQNQVTKSLNDVDVSDGAYGWMLERMPNKTG